MNEYLRQQATEEAIERKLFHFENVSADTWVKLCPVSTG